jgi:hypothetical protein
MQLINPNYMVIKGGKNAFNDLLCQPLFVSLIILTNQTLISPKKLSRRLLNLQPTIYYFFDRSSSFISTTTVQHLTFILI